MQVLAINVGQTEYDTLERMKQRAEEGKLNFPYLRDPSQDTSRELGARVTPQVFVLDAQRKIAYMGALDDNMLDPDAVKKPYLRDALDALLAGEQPRLRETRPSGCAIEYKPRP